ncbi:homocysteine S-methyltransferase family protein [Nitratireductor sp. XY-223]|uniref:homocysteine S-methyltransferase family protein n=1 Tax=Nitratireductor sp. XY-223 TaxID=2561926 RepID=UPI0010A9FE55|nr:homocysteine S-methyltransferase family protein [Nitratireductor sp. XY-223]
MTEAKYRLKLPQLNGHILLTDSGMETTLVFHDGYDLPYFAAFDLLRSRKGTDWLKAYYSRHAALAVEQGYGFVLETPTWRANPDWAELMGYSPDALRAVYHDAAEMLFDLRAKHERPGMPFVVSGNLGPRGDGYCVSSKMSAAEAEAYHGAQIAALAAAGVDMISALTINYAEEAEGIVRAAHTHGVPAAISFTLETDGRLPSGQSLEDAILQLDGSGDTRPAYFMLNCVHPEHFQDVIARGGNWTRRIRGLRANASRMSHAELDNCETLDDGDPVELGNQYRALLELMPNLSVLGGCCGTDHRHVCAIGYSCRHQAAA